MEGVIDHIYDNQSIIRSICRTYYSDPEDQKDLFQEIVIKLWKSADSFNHRSRFSTWLYRVALNTAITHKQKSGRYFFTSIDKSIPQESFDTNIDKNSELDTLYKAIDKLNKVEKAIIHLYLEEKSYEEMAEITGFTKSNVSVKLVRIKKKLEKIYRSMI